MLFSPVCQVVIVIFQVVVVIVLTSFSGCDCFSYQFFRLLLLLISPVFQVVDIDFLCVLWLDPFGAHAKINETFV